MRSKAYWAARAAALEEELQNGAEKLSEEMIAEYERAIEAINADIRDTFSAYVAMDIPEGEAVKLLNAAESDKTYAELMQLFEETTDIERRAEILARVNAQAYGARISRLEGVKSRILAEMTRVANTAVAAHKLFYTRTLQKSYYTNVYNIAKGLNCGIDFSLLPTRAINAALREPWNGANYSDRIWNHNDRFTEAVQNTVTTGIMAGHSVNRMAAQLEEYVKSEGADGVLYSTTRLVRTETAHFMNTGQKAAYDEIGIKKYRFVAALSERTCETCGGLDGKVFDVADAREGVNYPPMHPNCRCTTVMADAISKTRIARDPATGKNYKVDGNMTFEEWQESLTPEQKAAMETHVKEVRTKETKVVDNSGGSGIIKTGSEKRIMQSGAFYGALNPESDKDFARCEEHANRYYTEIRKRKSDISAIAMNTGYSEQDIETIKNHIFINKYDLGEEEPTTFYPNYDIAVSWQNLIEGKNIEEKDLILLQHEYYEHKLMIDEGLSYVEAHEKTQELYNYKKAVDDWRSKK